MEVSEEGIIRIGKKMVCGSCGAVNNIEFETDVIIRDIGVHALCNTCAQEIMIDLRTFLDNRVTVYKPREGQEPQQEESGEDLYELRESSRIAKLFSCPKCKTMHEAEILTDMGLLGFNLEGGCKSCGEQLSLSIDSFLRNVSFAPSPLGKPAKDSMPTRRASKSRGPKGDNPGPTYIR